MSRYGEDIRRIVGLDKINKTLQDLADRISILAQRGVGYFNADGTTGTGSGTPGTLGGTGGIGAGGAVSGAVNTATTAINAATTGTGGMVGGAVNQAATLADPMSTGAIKSNTDNTATISDLLDNFTNSELGTTLSGITGFTDCVSGKSISQVRLDGSYIAPLPTPPATPYVEASTAPNKTGWVSGFYIQDGGTGATFASGEDWTIYAYTQHGGYGTPYTDFVYNVLTGPPGNVSITSVAAGGTLRTGSTIAGTPGTSYILPLHNPKQDYWPTVSDFQVSWTAGGAAASVHDSVAPQNFQTAQAALNLCFGAGRKAQMEQNNLGGVNLFEIDPTSGAGIGVVRIYDSNQRLVGFTDQVGRYSYLP